MTPKYESDAQDEEYCRRDENIGVQRRCSISSDTDSSGSEDAMYKIREEGELVVSLVTSSESEEADESTIDKQWHMAVSSFIGRLTSETWECPASIIIIIVFVLIFQSSVLIQAETKLLTATDTNYTSRSIGIGESFDLSSTQMQNGTTASPSYLAFNNTNPHETSWCPNAKCRNSPICSPCNRRYLFIIATGRSGSTTLLSMLNYLPNVRLSGENNGELFITSLLESNLRKSKNHNILEQHDDREVSAWRHNGVPEQAMACPIQDIFYTINPPPTRVQQRVNIPGEPSLHEYDKEKIFGLKTIRIHKRNIWTPEVAAEFFKENFPCSRVVVNIRSDIDSQLKSRENVGWSKADSNSHGSLEEDNTFLKNFSKYLGDDMARLIDMNEWTGDEGVTVLNSLLKWLGYVDCEFQEVLHENHDGYGTDTTHIDLGDHCHYPL